MKLITPTYYSHFHCLASKCPDTCCQQWDIQVDPRAAEFYRSLPGPLGEKVRHSLYEEDGELLISLEGGHCPLEDSSGLCTLHAQLGEQALCDTCRDFPRLHHDYGDFLELQLELSCPEAARLMLTEEILSADVADIPGGSAPEYDQEAMEILLASRKTALVLLTEGPRTPEEKLSLLFFYGCHVQGLLDGGEEDTFDPEAALETAHTMGKAADFSSIAEFFSHLEVLTEQWSQLLKQAQEPVLTVQSVKLAEYMVQRYWLQAVSDYDLYCRVKFILISCLLVSALPGDFIWNAHLFSREIENDIDNVDALLDAAYQDPLFTDDKLLGFLLRTGGNSRD